MDKKENTNYEEMFQKGDFSFPFGDAQKMGEMMESCCKGEGNLIDCCSMMKRMMGHGRQKEPKKKDKTEEPPK